MDLTPDELSRTKSFLNKVNEARRQKNAVDLTLQTAVKFMSVSCQIFLLMLHFQL